MLDRKFLMSLLFVALLALPLSAARLSSHEAQNAASNDAVLTAREVTPKLFAERVFYRGQVRSVQMRNTGGVRFADDLYLLAGLVDVTGYSSGVEEKYQGYLLTEVHVVINGQPLTPGSYGIGLAQQSKFIVTDLAAINLLEVTAISDAHLNMPRPLQVVAAPDAGAYRLYFGRDYVTLKRTQ
jgi:hypothetical protein